MRLGFIFRQRARPQTTIPTRALTPWPGFSRLRALPVAPPVTAAPRIMSLRALLSRSRGLGDYRVPPYLHSRRIVQAPQVRRDAMVGRPIYVAPPIRTQVRRDYTPGRYHHGFGGLGGLGIYRMSHSEGVCRYGRAPTPAGQYGIWCYSAGETPFVAPTIAPAPSVSVARPASGPQYSAADVEAAARALQASLAEEAAALAAARGGAPGTQAYGGPAYGVWLETLRMLVPSAETGSILD